MNLLITFIVTAAIGIFGVVWVGVLVDKLSSPFVSLVVFFPLLSLVLWLAWRLSVKLTEPKSPIST
jgi:hypothetical protein